MTPEGPSLTLVKKLRAPPARVWEAWTRPDQMMRWFGPHHTHVETAEVDLREGGGFRVALRENTGERHEAVGGYTTIEPERRLVFRWNWASTPERVSRVTVELRVIGEGEGTMPGGGAMRWTVTMGYDSLTKRFRGTWVGSMMGSMFVYDGVLSADGKSLPLESEGPAFDGSGMASYRDTVTLEEDGTRRLSSAVKGPDGAWVTFMQGTFRRRL